MVSVMAAKRKCIDYARNSTWVTEDRGGEWGRLMEADPHPHSHSHSDPHPLRSN